MSFLVIYLCVGGVAGVLAGLLGIGGGLVIVPMLASVFPLQGIEHDVILHLALGTSLGTILFTSASSVFSHHKRGSVAWPIVFKISPGILFGTFAGTWVASMLSTNFLKIFFGLFIMYVATQMLIGGKPKAARDIPGSAGIFAAGSIIGLFSSLVGIGGGTLSVPFLTWCNTKIHTAIGTAAGIGIPIAVAGIIGYVVNGLGDPNLPRFSLGYIYLPALCGIVVVSTLTAPLGVRLAHRLPVDKLKRIFAVLLYLVSVKMLLSAVF